MKQVPVRYIGNEPSYTDHIYGTGVTWGFGEVELVPGDKAINILDHSEFEDARDDQTLSVKDFLNDAEPLAVKNEDTEKEEQELLDQQPPLANLDTMTKVQLIEYAHRNFGVQLPDTSKKAELISTIRLQMGKRVA